MAGMVEFAGIMLLQRQNRLIRSNKVAPNGQLARRGSFEMDELTTKIDMIALTVCSLSYILFNMQYWAGHLM